jgi:threonine dehydratase
VVAFSSGNFAQGLAAAGEALGIPVTIVMPIDAPAAKRRGATRGLWRYAWSSTDHGDRAREEVAAEQATRNPPRRSRASPCCIPFDDPEIVAGQGGAGLEALRPAGRAKGVAADIDAVLGRGRRADRRGRALAFHSPFAGDGPVRGGARGLQRAWAHRWPMARFRDACRSAESSICDGLMARRPGVAPFAAVQDGQACAALTVDGCARCAAR